MRLSLTLKYFLLSTQYNVLHNWRGTKRSVVERPRLCTCYVSVSGNMSNRSLRHTLTTCTESDSLTYTIRNGG